MLWAETYETIEEFRLALLRSAKLCTEPWLIERKSIISPAQRRGGPCAGRCRKPARDLRARKPMPGRPSDGTADRVMRERREATQGTLRIHAGL